MKKLILLSSVWLTMGTNAHPDENRLSNTLLLLQNRIDNLQSKVDSVISDQGDWLGEPSNFKGPQGFAGNKGSQGDRGPKGERGKKGDIGATGPKGSKGPKGYRGDTGEDGRIIWIYL